MSCLRTIGRLVSEFARLILFVASVVFLLSSLLMLAFTYQSRRDFIYAKVDAIENGLTVLVGLSIYLIVLAILGMFASFFSNKGTIKLLALMLTLNVILGVVVLNTSYPKFENAHTELEAKFRDYLLKYDWDHTNSDADIKDGTQSWDNLQTDAHCCGLHSPKDWSQYRPKTLAENMLPLSCCQKVEEVDTSKSNVTSLYCDSKTEKFWSDGCSIEMEGAMAAIFYMLVGLVGFSFVLGVLSILVIGCHQAPAYYESY